MRRQWGGAVRLVLAAALVAPALLTGCIDDTPESQDGADPMDLQSRTELAVTSTAYAEGDTIPTKYTCDGANVSPPLSFGSPPDGAETIALIMEDPDAPRGTFIHWLAWNLPKDTRALDEDADIEALGGREGENDMGEVGYAGPCPPSGAHRYFLHVYVLDKRVELEPGADVAALKRAMDSAVVAKGGLMGSYERS